MIFQIGFVSVDMGKNMLVSMYKPDEKEAAGGKNLIRQCDFNLGKSVMAMWNSRARQNDTYSKVSLLENEGRWVF